MKVNNSQPVERDGLVEQAHRAELVERITRVIRDDGMIEPLKGIYLHRLSSPNEPLHSVSEPHFGVIAQGSKEIYLGEECYRYDPYHYCLGTVGLPVASRVIEVSKERPYLSLSLKLDPVLIGSVMSELGHAAPLNHTDVKALSVSTLDPDILDAVVCLIRLIDTPSDA